MKMIPTDELIYILSHTKRKLMSKETIDDLFEAYGDDYFMDYGYPHRWTMTHENEERKKYVNSK